MNANVVSNKKARENPKLRLVEARGEKERARETERKTMRDVF